MLAFVNPFKKQDATTFPGVLIPLRRAQRPTPEDAGDEANADGQTTGEEDEALLPSDEGTIDDLKTQLDKELVGSETAYDRKFTLIDWTTIRLTFTQGSRESLIEPFKMLVWAGISGNFSSSAAWVGWQTSQ